jgi:hypothetical protein
MLLQARWESFRRSLKVLFPAKNILQNHTDRTNHQQKTFYKVTPTEPTTITTNASCASDNNAHLVDSLRAKLVCDAT